MLFNKRTKKVIKYIWGGFSLLIILSMIFAYSGFSLLARTASRTATPPPASVDVSEPVIARDTGTTTSAEVQLVPTVDKQPPVTPTQDLDFSL